MEIALSIALGIALAAATGFRVFVPLLRISVAAQAGHLELGCRGFTVGNEAIYFERLERRNEQVRNHFRHRPESPLQLDITAGDGWEALCPFLDCPVPAATFPHAGKAETRELQRSYLGRLRYRLRHLFER